MIHLNPPYAVVDGYTVLPDHADPSLFYVLPRSPRLAMTPEGRPSFSLLQYLGGGAGDQRVAGGLLTLGTELSISDEEMAALNPKVKARLAGGESDIVLSPVLFDEGIVELIALGSTSAAPVEGAPPPVEGPFKLHFLGSGKPSLGGRNESAFQLVLDQMGADLLGQCIEQPDLPVIAVYRLAFSGLRPSFSIKIDVDWQKVYSSLKNRVNANVWFVAVDAETEVTKAFENAGIDIDTIVFSAAEGAAGAAERARKQLLDWALERLFQPLADPSGATANAIGNVIQDTVWSLARTVLPGVGYRLRMLSEEQVRTLNVRMDETVAERREIVPQGTLGGLLQHLRLDEQGRERPTWPALRDSLIQQVNLDGFPRLEVKVGVEDRFAADGLSEVRVELARRTPAGGFEDERAFAFRDASSRQDYLVNLLGRAENPFDLPYHYRTEVLFNPAGPFGAHAPATSEWQLGRTAQLIAEPRAVYSVREIDVGVTPTFSFAQFPAVTVELRYAGEGAETLQTDRVQLSAEAPQTKWRYRSFSPQLLPYEYRVTYHRDAATGGPIAGEWRQSAEDWLSIADPLPRKRPLTMLVNLPWPEIALAFIQLRYDDDRNDIHIDEQIDLTPESRAIRRDYGIAGDGPRTLRYRLTLVLNNNDIVEGSWRETEDERLLLDKRLVESRVVAVKLIGGPFATAHLAEVRVGLEVRDPQTSQARESTEIVVKAGQEGNALPPWEYRLGDPPVRTVHYRATFVEGNGAATRVPWTPTERDLIVLHAGNRTATA
jgi:hypothetical protein